MVIVARRKPCRDPAVRNRGRGTVTARDLATAGIQSGLVSRDQQGAPALDYHDCVVRTLIDDRDAVPGVTTPDRSNDAMSSRRSARIALGT